MRNTLLLGGALLALAACSTADQNHVQTALASPLGQLFCAIESDGGPIVAGMIDSAANPMGATGAKASAGQLAVIATGKSAAFVAATCKAAGGIPVSPPANPAAAPQVAVAVPAAS